MERSGMRIFPVLNGIDLYAELPGSVEDFLEYFERATSGSYLVFEIRSIDPHFYVYTDLPVNWTGELYYDSAEGANVTPAFPIELSPTLSENTEITRMGEIRIRYKDLIKAHQKWGKATFSLRFKSRSTRWEYYIINQTHHPVEQLSIASRSEIRFIGPMEVSLPDGSPALLFSNEGKLIPLSENPQYKFDLVTGTLSLRLGREGIRSPVMTLRKGLPCADVQNTQLSSSGKIMSSQMYVCI